MFTGDTSATQVVGLTEEITAIVTNARPERGDKVSRMWEWSIVMIGSESVGYDRCADKYTDKCSDR